MQTQESFEANDLENLPPLDDRAQAGEFLDHVQKESSRSTGAQKSKINFNPDGTDKARQEFEGNLSRAANGAPEIAPAMSEEDKKATLNRILKQEDITSIIDHPGDRAPVDLVDDLRNSLENK